MAITIRNKETEELIRRIGRRTGEGPSAVVRRLAENENAGAEQNKVSAKEAARRLKLFEELREKYPPPHPKPTWKEIEDEINSLYDYLDAPDASLARTTGR